jgi:hypothetical protein
MAKNKSTLTVMDEEISVTQIEGVDYFSLNDMLAIIKDNDKQIDNWLRNKGTLDFIGYWEKKYNQDFNSLEFEEVRNSAGKKEFTMSVKKLHSLANLKGIISRSGRYGGTYAHKDIAMEFAMWLSPEFKLHVIHAYQQYLDALNGNIKWQLQRLLSKTTLRILTDAIKNNVVPYEATPHLPERLLYAREIDSLNVSVMGSKARDWRAKNPELAIKRLSQRDQADIYTLTILSSMQTYDAILINKGLPFKERQRQIDDAVRDQIKVLFNIDTLHDNSPLELK